MVTSKFERMIFIDVVHSGQLTQAESAMEWIWKENIRCLVQYTIALIERRNKVDSEEGGSTELRGGRRNM